MRACQADGDQAKRLFVPFGGEREFSEPRGRSQTG